MNRQSKFALLLCSGLCLPLILIACAPKFQEVRVANVPINPVRPGSQEIDLDIAFEPAKESIRDVLPAAYFRGMVFSGKCQDLSSLRGKLVLIFEQVRPGLFKQQVVRGDASIDTITQMMNLQFVDETEFYPVVRQETFVGDDSFKAIAMLASRHITELGLNECDVTLTQMDDSWDVRCGPLDNFVQKCRFTIANGKVIDKPK